MDRYGFHDCIKLNPEGMSRDSYYFVMLQLVCLKFLHYGPYRTSVERLNVHAPHPGRSGFGGFHFNYNTWKISGLKYPHPQMSLACENMITGECRNMVA